MITVIPMTYVYTCDVCGAKDSYGIQTMPRNWHMIRVDGEYATEIKELWCESCVRLAVERMKDKGNPR